MAFRGNPYHDYLRGQGLVGTGSDDPLKTLLAQLTFGAGISAPNRQPGNVPIQYVGGSSTVPMSGLFGGGQQTQRRPGTPVTPRRENIAPPGWEPTAYTYEDVGTGVKDAQADPTWARLQEWLNRRFPNEG